jgi:predicted permease
MLLQDLRYAVRTLRRDRGFTGFAVLISALGIGASSTVFSVVNTLLLRPLPFEQPQQLVWIANHQTAGLSGQTTQVGHMLDLRERTQALSAVAGYFAFYGAGDTMLSGRGEPQRLNAVPVSDNFFQTLGVAPVLGRTFNAEEVKIHGPKAALISHGLWTRRFASDPSIVGSPLMLNDEPVTVVGVLPPSFDFGSLFAPGTHFDLYTAFPLAPETNRWGNTMAMIGRLKPGVSIAQAQAEVRTIAARLTGEHPERNSFGGFVSPLADRVSGRIRSAVWVLAGAVGVVMLIVCANLSNLLLARTAARQKEMAIRSALGAGRRHLVVQMLTEAVMLSCSGAVLGLAVAVAGTRALAHLDAVSVPLLAGVRVDVTALVFTVALALATGIVFGLAPALYVPETSLHDALRDAARGSTGRRTWVRNALVVAEVAFACVLLVGAGLLLRSFVRVLDVDLGFRPFQAITVRVDSTAPNETWEARIPYLTEVLRRVRDVPGVQAAGITDALPLGRNRTWGVRAKGVTYERGRAPSVFPRMVSDGYFAAMGIPLKAGRDFTPQDVKTSENVIIVNDTMARAVWPGQDPIGKVVLGACAAERRVVGVVADVKHLALEQGAGNEMYIPLRQCDDLPSADLVVRSMLADAAAVRAVREALAPIVPNIDGNEFRRVQSLVDRSVSPRRFMLWMLGAFAVFALVLASLGIYALISYSVNQRTQEIGIRMALGASARDVQARVVAHTLALASTGMALGAAASWLLGRSLSGLLFGVTPADPLTFAAMLGVLTLVALTAGYLPARRASRIDPLVALRTE